VYCMKCRSKRVGENHQDKLIKNNTRYAIIATCEICGTKMYKMSGKRVLG